MREPRPKWCKKDKAAELLCCSVRTLERRIAEGELETKRHLGRVLISFASIEAYLDSLPSAH